MNHRKFLQGLTLALFFGLPVFGGCNVAPAPVDVEGTVAAAVVATQQAANLPATIEAAVAATVAAQQVLPPPTPELPTPIPVTTLPAASAEIEAIRDVIQNEVNGAVNRDLALLESLYAPEATVIDRGGTPANPADDTIWQGWANIARRYEAFFSSGVTSIALIDLSIQLNGDQAVGVHRGAVLDDITYPDEGIYRLQKIDGRWLITGLEYGNIPPPATPPTAVSATVTPPPQNDGLYELQLGSQHRYEEPWGWDRGDPCRAWETNDFDDTRPNYRGFNVELLLTNNSDEKVPDEWPISFTTANGQSVKACYYRYDGSGPEPGETSSVTFFTVVEQGDYVDTITLNLAGQTVQICLDGQGGWWPC